MSSSLFQNASQFSTGDVTVNISSNNINNYSSFDSARDALELLLKHTTKEATHESVTYSYSPTCHPRTRKVVQSGIMHFIHDSQGGSRKLAWLSGPAGAGKSCIQRSIVNECLSQNILGGTFFFGRHFGRDSADGFVATIAHQLCNVIPGFRDAMLKKISFDPSIFEKSLVQQTQHLILDSLDDVDQIPEWIVGPEVITIIVDGLDECRDPRQRLQVIRLLGVLARHPTFPFCVIVSSRPETDILTAYSEELQSITWKVSLPTYDSDKEIRAYLVEEFARIRRTHPARRRLQKHWPPQEPLDMLVKMASGQFIFVSTVITHIEHGPDFPDRLLESLLKIVSAREAPPKGYANPLAELDALYTGLLQFTIQKELGAVDRSHLRLILHAIPEMWRVVETNSLLVESRGIPFDLGPSAGMLDSFFDLEPGTTDVVLSRLRALIHSPQNGHVRFYHKNMEDYLKTPERSGDFYQSEADTAAQFILASTKNLERWSLALKPPGRDMDAAFGALYLCVRFTWNQIPNEPAKKRDIMSDLQVFGGAEVLDFDLTLLLGWILLFGRRLWPNPHDMLTHMKPQSAPLEGLRGRWLDPIVKGVKILHTCERSLWLKWKNPCPPLCKIVQLCRRNSQSLFSFLEENWHLDRHEKIMILGEFDKIIPPSGRRKRFQWWIQGQTDARAFHDGSSDSASGTSGPPSTVFNFPSKSTQSLSLASWSSRSSLSSVSPQLRG